MSKKTFERELYLLLKNTTQRNRDTWSLYYENFKDDNLDFCKKFSEKLVEFETSETETENWGNLLRKIYNWEEGGVTEMMEQLDFLMEKHAFSRRVFTMNSKESGTFSLPNTQTMVNKVLRIGKKLVQDIFPEILNGINSSYASKTTTSENFSGNINWPKTIEHNLHLGRKSPTTFVTLSHERNYDTPENQLGVLSMLILKKDISRILQDKAIVDELRGTTVIYHFMELNDSLERLLHSPLTRLIVKKMKDYEDVSMSKNFFQSKVRRVQERIDSKQIKQNSYKSLLRWIKDYSGNNIHKLLGEHVGVSKEFEEKSIDIIYEWWILFSLLDIFIKNKIKVVNFIFDPDDKNILTGFVLSNGTIQFKLLYEKEFSFHEFGKEHFATPDFVMISMDEKFAPVVMDAKNYLSTRSGEAVTMLLNYRNQLALVANTKTVVGFFPKLAEHYVASESKSIMILASSLNKSIFIENIIHLYNDVFSKAIASLEGYEKSKA